MGKHLDLDDVAAGHPNHPYVRKLVGCGHGRLFSEPCVDCEVVGLMDEYKRAVKTVMRVRDRMRVLGRPMPGHNAIELTGSPLAANPLENTVMQEEIEK